MVKNPSPPLLKESGSLKDPVLVLMLKRAVPGYGKQRLAREIGQDNALHIASSLLDCALEDAANWQGDLAFAISKESEREWAKTLAARRAYQKKSIQIVRQCSGNLGERLHDLDQQLRQSSERKVLLMAGDAPGLRPTHFEQSLNALDHGDISLINSTDGGTDLMGSRSGWPPMSDLPWGGSDLADALSQRCDQHALQLHRFDGSFDIDTATDLKNAVKILSKDIRPARRHLLEKIVQLNSD